MFPRSTAGAVVGHMPEGPSHSQILGACWDCVLSPAPANAEGSSITAVAVGAQLVLLPSPLVQPSHHTSPGESWRLGDAEAGGDVQFHQLMALQLPWPQSCFQRLIPSPAAPSAHHHQTQCWLAGLPALKCGVSRGQQSPKVPVRQQGRSRDFLSCLELSLKLL